MSYVTDFEKIRLAAMEKKCPGAGFSAEGHKARKGTEVVTADGSVTVLCDKCRTWIELPSPARRVAQARYGNTIYDTSFLGVDT